MVNMTLAIPEQLHVLMKKHSDIRWSEVARKAIEERAQKLEFMDKFLANSKLTKEDIDFLDHKIKADIFKKFEERRKRAAQNENNS